MKKIFKALLSLLLVIIFLVDIMLTIYLLSYNKYNIAEINNKSLLIMTEDIDNYKKGDLLVVTKPKGEDIKTGDDIFFYNDTDHKNLVNFGKVVMVNNVKDGHNTYTMESRYLLSHDNVIGKREDIKVYKNYGTILKFMSSRWVFLIVIIFPILLLFLYELYLLVLELKKASN